MLCQNKADPEPEHLCTIVSTDTGKRFVVEHETGMAKGDEIQVVDTLLFWGDEILNLIDGCEPPPTLGEFSIA